MIGEYGEFIKEGPYILESIIDGFKTETSNSVRLELLTATVKLFFKRPPEVHAMLGRLLASAIENSAPVEGSANVPVQIDVRDKALFYYNLLKKYGIQP